MNRTLRSATMAGWIGIMGLGQAGMAAPADGTDGNLKIAVHIRNYARADQSVLERAGQIAVRIFRNVGVEAVVAIETEETPSEVEATLPSVCHLYVDILPREMVARLNVPADYMGVAPGNASTQDRRKVFVFDHMIEKLAKEQIMARVEGKIFRVPDKAQILGHAAAHEIGHVLLYQASHSPTGLMRANWDRNELQNMVVGELGFTPSEAKRVRTEILRRNAKLTALEAVRSRQE